MDAHRQGGGVEKEIILQSWLHFVGKVEVQVQCTSVLVVPDLQA
jgi:hypothetical protein